MNKLNFFKKDKVDDNIRFDGLESKKEMSKAIDDMDFSKYFKTPENLKDSSLKEALRDLDDINLKKSLIEISKGKQNDYDYEALQLINSTDYSINKLMKQFKEDEKISKVLDFVDKTHIHDLNLAEPSMGVRINYPNGEEKAIKAKEVDISKKSSKHKNDDNELDF